MKQKEVSLNLKETATPPLLPITPPIPVATVSCYITYQQKIPEKFQENSKKIQKINDSEKKRNLFHMGVTSYL